MVNKKQLDLHEFRTATAALGETVPLFCNGIPVTGIDTASRNGAGDLQINLLTTAQDVIAEAPTGELGAPPVEAVDPPATDAADRLDLLVERRKNDPGSLTEDEVKELAHLEALAGVEERRSGSTPGGVADTGNEGDPL